MRVIPAIRFWSKVDVRGQDECWPWLSTRQGSGYGQFWLKGRYVPTTHAAWALTGCGPMPPRGMFMCHTCDHPWCVNPRHLFLATPRENTADMYRKGRANPPRGERQTTGRLTAREVSQIRERYARGERQKSLALEYGVDPSSISNIIKGATWVSA